MRIRNLIRLESIIAGGTCFRLSLLIGVARCVSWQTLGPTVSMLMESSRWPLASFFAARSSGELKELAVVSWIGISFYLH